MAPLWPGFRLALYFPMMPLSPLAELVVCSAPDTRKIYYFETEEVGGRALCQSLLELAASNAAHGMYLSVAVAVDLVKIDLLVAGTSAVADTELAD